MAAVSGCIRMPVPAKPRLFTAWVFTREKLTGLQFNRKAVQGRQCSIWKDPEKRLKDLNSGSASIRNQLVND